MIKTRYAQNMHTLKVSFRKEGEMIYFSQLDIFRLLLRALRRAGFNIHYTSGFNPHPKLSFSRAVKLGMEGSFETTFYFEEAVTPREFKERFSAHIPDGLTIEDHG